jgi:hypothetical protein
MTKTGPRDDTRLAAIILEWWPRSDWNKWPPSLESPVSRDEDHRIILTTTWLDGEDYTSEFWSVSVALSAIISTIAKATAEMEPAV